MLIDHLRSESIFVYNDILSLNLNVTLFIIMTRLLSTIQQNSPTYPIFNLQYYL